METNGLYRRMAASLLACAASLPAAVNAQPTPGNEVDSLLTTAGPIAVHEVVSGLDQPWALEFLPDGRLLITERTGHLLILDKSGKLSKPVSGTPKVFAQGQGGLMDVALHPDFKENQLVYLSFAHPGPQQKAATALGRGRLVGDKLEDFEVVFRQEPWVDGPNHFGNRIVFDGKGHVYLALGDRFQFEPAQDLSNHLGTVVRLNEDGSIPSDNPFVDQENAEDAIWSYGHRNIEAAAWDPATDSLWVMEMGPLGGDELNRVEKGKNYGWPVVSWGMNYDGTDIPDPPTKPKFADAVEHFSPVVSPSGMIFYNGDQFSEWRGHALVGGLSSHQLLRLEIEGDKLVSRETLPLPARIRDVEEGPDGNLYVLTGPRKGKGKLWQISPLETPGNEK